MPRPVALAVALLAVTTTLSGPAASAPTGLRDVMFVGNNWDGTASIVDAHTYRVLKRGVDLIPDKVQELRDIALNPVRLVYYLAIQQGRARATTGPARLRAGGGGRDLEVKDGVGAGG